MAVQALRRRPGKLERNDEHEKNGNQTAHVLMLAHHTMSVDNTIDQASTSALRVLAMVYLN
jgi:hypothetical protein